MKHQFVNKTTSRVGSVKKQMVIQTVAEDGREYIAATFGGKK